VKSTAAIVEDRLERAASVARRTGAQDGRVAACKDRDDCDPRGAFIRRPSITEEFWPEYETAFEVEFLKTIRTVRR
jgi:hypothetical protein